MEVICTMIRKGETYDLLIKNEKGSVVVSKTEIPICEAVAEIENRMYTTEVSSGREE